MLKNSHNSKLNVLLIVNHNQLDRFGVIRSIEMILLSVSLEFIMVFWIMKREVLLLRELNQVEMNMNLLLKMISNLNLIEVILNGEEVSLLNHTYIDVLKELKIKMEKSNILMKMEAHFCK